MLTATPRAIEGMHADAMEGRGKKERKKKKKKKMIFFKNYFDS
jgi:hypothetical protein